jgi:hypothetical protein
MLTVREDHYDVISGLNNRDQLEETFQASSPIGRENSASEPNEDPESMALEQYLASRLQQIGEIPAEPKKIKGLKTGNGWDSAQIIEHVYKIDPISLKHAAHLAISSNRRLRERIKNKILKRSNNIKIIGPPTVEFLPIWKINGFYECYYLRTDTYKINVKEDVVGVEVEGKSRNLILEQKHSRSMPSLILERLQRLGGFLSSESKYFVINDVVELACSRSDSELVMTGNGRKLSQDDELTLTSWRSKRIFDQTDLKVRGANVKVRDPAISKESVLAKFREQVVRIPERFKEILSNRLQITELKRIYVPLIRIPIQKGMVPREIVVNGSSGKLADNNLLQLFE